MPSNSSNWLNKSESRTPMKGVCRRLAMLMPMDFSTRRRQPDSERDSTEALLDKDVSRKPKTAEWTIVSLSKELFRKDMTLSVFWIRSSLHKKSGVESQRSEAFWEMTATTLWVLPSLAREPWTWFKVSRELPKNRITGLTSLKLVPWGGPWCICSLFFVLS